MQVSKQNYKDCVLNNSSKDYTYRKMVLTILCPLQRLLDASTLSSLLDKYAPIITKLTKRQSPSNPWFTPALRTFRSTVRHAENLWKHTHSAVDLFSFKSLRNQYHKLILTSKKQYYCCLLYTSPSPRDGLLSRMPSSA